METTIFVILIFTVPFVSGYYLGQSKTDIRNFVDKPYCETAKACVGDDCVEITKCLQAKEVKR